MTVVLVTLVAALLRALRQAPRAADVEPDADSELAVGMRPGAGSVIDLRRIPASREVLEQGGTAAQAETAARAVQPL